MDLTVPRAQAPAVAATRILCLLFFFSGFPALIYQLTWQRALYRIFGVNTESVTIVVTAFMLGLGLGSLAGGWLSKRRSAKPLLLLAVIEMATAAFGLISLDLFETIGMLAIDWPLAAVAAINLSLVIVPTLLMGATLPFLVAHLVRHQQSVGGTVGLLYYVNTLGAGTACLVCCVLLFPFAGMRGAVLSAAAMNVTVAIGALVMQMRSADSAVVPASTPIVRASKPLLPLPSAMTLAAVGGYISLSYEIFLFRTVSYESGSSATAFALTLSSFLVGIASGARDAGEACKTLPRSDIAKRAVDELMRVNLIGLVFLPLMTQLAGIGEFLLGLALLATYLIARRWGALLPYLAEFSIANVEQAGSMTSALYFANIMGSAAGAVITGFVLMDHFGLVPISIGLTIAGVACTLLLQVFVEPDLTRAWRQTVVAFAVVACAIVAIPPLSRQLLENLQAGGKLDHAFAAVIENRSGIITVDTDGTVFGNGMYDGRFNTDLRNSSNGVIRPYALSLFHAAPRDVLMIGLSSGSWAQIIASNPAVASLTVVEINPGYSQLIAQHPQVASVLHNPKVSLVVDDGRRWLSHHPERHFDAIISNTTWNYRANVTNLLSSEFLELVQRHLKPGGMVFYNTTDSARAQRTACLIFPHGARFANHMIASDRPIDWNFDRWRHAVASTRIDDKAEFDLANPADRAALDALADELREPGRVIEDCADVLTRTAGLAAITDDNMGTEWRHSLGLE